MPPVSRGLRPLTEPPGWGISVSRSGEFQLSVITGSPPRCGDGQGPQNTALEQAAARRAGRRSPGRRDLVRGNEDGVQGRPVARVSLVTIAGQWLRLGCIGFGGCLLYTSDAADDLLC